VPPKSQSGAGHSPEPSTEAPPAPPLGTTPGSPLGVRLAAVAKMVSRAFDDALVEAGGSRPIWLVLMAVRTHAGASQQQLADQIGIRGATLNHHLSAVEEQGLVTRMRDPGNLRVQVVRLRPEGERMFEVLRDAAHAFDRRLRSDLDDEDVAAAYRVLSRLEANVQHAHTPATSGPGS
jgi:MarR family transcriptional regulator, transcriptional regulator for hemolysin